MCPLNKTYRQVLDNSPESVEVVLEIPSFAGGENTVGQDQELKSNEARVIENWDSDSLGGMVRSKGFTQIASNLGGIDTYTKLMLHMNGTNGSTTFTDSELTPKTVTANGNAQISTAQSKFGGASGLFDGTGDYLTIPDSADFTLGSNNFTIEFWIRFVALPTAGAVQEFYQQATTAGTNETEFAIQEDAGNYNLIFQVASGGVGIIACTASAVALSNNTWYHFAVIRGWGGNANDYAITKDGTSVGTATDSSSIPDWTGSVYIGARSNSTRFLNGYIDEFRFSNGIARWTSNFTPSAIAYAAYSGAPDCVLHHFEGTTTRDYVIENGDLLKIDGSTLTATDAAAFTSGALTCGLSAGNRAWFTNSTDNLKYTTIAGSITVPTGTPPSARERIYYHKSRLIAEGGGVTVYGSRAGTGNWHASANTWSSSGDAWSIDLPDLTQGCAPGFPAGGQITVFTKFGAYALTGMPNVAQNFILGSHGCSQPLSIQLGAEGLYLFSLYPTLGIFLWDGSSWINLTVNETWVSEVSLTNRCYGIYSENKYRFFYNDNTSGVSYPNVCRIYDARWGRWMSRAINSSVADTFGYPMLRTKVDNSLYVASSQNNVIYQLEDTSNSDNGYDTQSDYKTKDFTSKDFGLPRDEVRMKLLKATVSFYGSTGNFLLQWTADRGAHSGSITIPLATSGQDLLNTTFTLNSSYLATPPPDKTITRSFNNTAVGRRFSFELINNGTGDRVKIKKIKILAIALEEA